MNDSTRDTARAAVAAPAALVSVIFLWIPHGIHGRNTFEFGFGFLSVLPFLIVASAATLVVLLWLGGQFKEPVRRRAWLVALNLVTALVWGQYAVIGWDYGPLDGRSLHWTGMILTGVVDLSFWVIVLALGIAFARRVPTKAVLRFSYFLLATFALNSVVTATQSPSVAVPEGEAYELDDSKRYRFSSLRNIIVVVWDEFQANEALEVLDEHPELGAQLDGFKVFRNALGGYQSTIPSIPYILSGEMYDNSRPFSDYLEQAHVFESAPRALKAEGYLADLMHAYPGSFHRSLEIQDNLVSDTASLARGVGGAVRLIELTLFAASPHFLKGLTYSRGEWLLSGLLASIDTYADLARGGQARVTDVEITGTSDDQDLLTLREMAREIHVTTDHPVFKFYHFRGAHVPFNVDSSGARVAPETDRDHYRELLEYKLYLMTKLIEILKDARIFDNSLIVFTSDHGSGRSEETRVFRHPQTGRKLPGNLDVKARATPFLAAKFPGERGPLRLSDRPVSLGDVRRMLLDGDDAFIEERTGSGVRRYVLYEWSENFSEYLTDFREYAITEHSWLDEAWTPYHLHPKAFDPRGCFFSNSANRELVATEVYAADLAPGGTLEIGVPASERHLFGLIRLAELSDGLLRSHRIRVTQGSRTLFFGSLGKLGDFQESIGVSAATNGSPLDLSFETSVAGATVTLDRVVWLAYDPCSGNACTDSAQQVSITDARSVGLR
jgi:hypothetical protein